MDIKQNWIDYIHDLQNRICVALEEADGKAKFIEDSWERPEGGGGKTRVIANGAVFEKGGVKESGRGFSSGPAAISHEVLQPYFCERLRGGVLLITYIFRAKS